MPTHYKGTAEEVLALDTYIKLSRAMNSFEDRVLSHSILGKLTISQFGALEALYHLGPMCQGQLSQKLLKSTGNITMVVDNLEKSGFVRRVRSLEDRRMIQIKLTPTGAELIARVFPLQAAAIVAEMSVLTPNEQSVLSELCRKLGKGKKGNQPVESFPGEKVPESDTH